MKNYLQQLIAICSLSLLLISCEKNDSGISSENGINNFVWQGLNTYYLWQEQVPNLADTRFPSSNELNSFLNNYDAPDNLFYSLLYQYEVVDKFSWIVDDYIALENSFQGINTTNGMEFGLTRYANNPSNLFGYVRYVLPGSDAETQGVIRGYIFNQVDGTQLTEANYRSLLFSDAVSYSITVVDYNNGNPTATNTTINLTKAELQENPVAVATTFDEGANKIGYLIYNQFASSYDDELNAAFGTFKTEGITDLIVDLRYNPGGSVRTATYLGQMITGQFTGQLFSQEVWNSKVTDAIDNPSFFVNNFTSQINNGIVTESINSLNLTRVYFIVTESTASASELIINSLSSYIDVKLVGTTTTGKNVGSVTLYDSSDFLRDGANPNHTWAMQPIVLEIQNKDGGTNPAGFTAEVNMPEDYGNMGVLGQRGEPLLERAITYITTGARFSGKHSGIVLEEVSNSKLFTPAGNNMYVGLKR